MFPLGVGHSGQGVTVLLNVRRGNIGKSGITDMHDILEREFSYAKENTVLPAEPNITLVNEWTKLPIAS